MYYFIGVNYGTSNLIESWWRHISKHTKDAKFIIVDNFKSQNERKKVEKICNNYKITLIKLDNIGYGKALNIAIKYCVNQQNKVPAIIFAGNLDIEFSHIPKKLEHGNYVYIPKVMEGYKNRNPFLTKLQKKVVGLYRVQLPFSSPIALNIMISLTKFLGFFPSPTWATHGALFCFNMQVIDSSLNVFNEESFLYCEELEFASYMEKQGAIFLDSNIACNHIGGVATSSIISSKKDFLKIWKPSMKNWINKWH